MFQFQSGAIKGGGVGSITTGTTEFQFQSGAIKGIAWQRLAAMEK